MVQVSIWIPDDLKDRIDEQGSLRDSRSKWIREAIEARLEAEDAGEWGGEYPRSDNRNEKTVADA